MMFRILPLSNRCNIHTWSLLVVGTLACGTPQAKTPDAQPAQAAKPDSTHPADAHKTRQGATCSDAASAVESFDRDYRVEGGQREKEARERAGELAAIVSKRCTTDGWAQPAIDCYASWRDARTRRRTCHKQLSPAQQSELKKAVVPLGADGLYAE